MASLTPLMTALEEATCSICLEYLTEPVTIECGHNFCRACLTQFCERGEPELDTALPCPQCRAPFQQQTLRPNRQLADIVESIKTLRLQPWKAQEKNLCETHQQKLQLFCEEDGKAICVVCRESRAHRAHPVLPVEEAAQSYKEKLQGALGHLRQELEKALVLASEEEKKTSEWQVTVETQRRLITGQFKTLHRVLHAEEQLLLRRLVAEEEETLRRLQDNITKLSAQNAALISLITEMEEKCQQPAIALLQDVKSALIRSEYVKLQPPKAVSPTLKNVYKICLDMREMLERFTVDVTLDPDTAHPKLVLSAYGKCVRLGDTRQALPDTPERFDHCACVLGAEGFTSGRRYWQVEVGDKPEWDLGVCRESLKRKGNITLSPGNGCWVVLLRYGKYMAATSPPTSLPVSSRPWRVGIFLDYEAGEVSFYNVTDGSHLFTFTDTFSGTLRPYFSPCPNRNADPLIICPVPV